MWRDVIAKLFEDAEFSEPAAHYSSPFIWPLEEIVTQNLLFRNNSRFDDLKDYFRKSGPRDE